MSDQQRFEAAKAAMQGLCADPNYNVIPDQLVVDAVRIADALLAELARTAPKPSEPAEQALSIRDEIASWPEWKRKAAAAAFCKPKFSAPQPSLNSNDINCDLRPGEAEDNKPSAPDVLLMARLKAAEALCDWLAMGTRHPLRLMEAWRLAKAEHEAQESTP